MHDLPRHFCPGCGSSLPPSERYPWFFCNDCMETAQDGNSRRLVFSNEDFSGGFIWGYDEDNLHRAHAALCLIAQRPAVVTEAHFGGIVAQPVPSKDMWQHPRGLVDLIDKPRSR